MLRSFFTQEDQEMDYALQLHVQWINYKSVCKELKTRQWLTQRGIIILHKSVTNIGSSGHWSNGSKLTLSLLILEIFL